MKRVLASAAIIASTMIATPIAAQAYSGGQGYQREYNSGEMWRGAPADPWQRIQFLQQRIDRGVRDGSLDRREARRAEFRLRQIRQEAWQMRRRDGGVLRGRDAEALQARLDEIGRNLRWTRHDGDRAYSGGYGRQDEARFHTDYDASRHYRDGPNYRERRLTARDEVYRGSDGRYYCKRSDGTTGLIIGGISGALIGNAVDNSRSGVAGTLIGGALGALAGKAIEQNSDVRCR
jgi:hypothetical protein